MAIVLLGLGDNEESFRQLVSTPHRALACPIFERNLGRWVIHGRSIAQVTAAWARSSAIGTTKRACAKSADGSVRRPRDRRRG